MPELALDGDERETFKGLSAMRAANLDGAQSDIGRQRLDEVTQLARTVVVYRNLY